MCDSLFLGLSFHFIYRSAIGVCLAIENKAVAYYSIFVLSTTAELSGLAPLYYLFWSLRLGSLGKVLQRKLLREAVISSAIAAALGIGIIPDPWFLKGDQTSSRPSPETQTLRPPEPTKGKKAPLIEKKKKVMYF